MTNKQRLKKYESFIHLLASNYQVGNQNNIRRLLDNADNWSYAHRVGNGELSDYEQQKIVDTHTLRLTNL